MEKFRSISSRMLSKTQDVGQNGMDTQQSSGFRRFILSGSSFSNSVQTEASVPEALPVDPLKPEHLVIMANGLFGNRTNWEVMIKSFPEIIEQENSANQQNLGGLPNIEVEKYVVHASSVNEFLKTFDGLDVCGQRLAAEVQEVASKYPNLKYISFFGHSFGGLMIRYALGKLFDLETKRILGLEPRHFIAMATPHMGCHATGPYQVPFIEWTAALPVVGDSIKGGLQKIVEPGAQLLYRRSGEHMFYADGKEDGTKPLLVQLTEGVNMAALQQFRSRTCYANASQDHIVSWENASIRRYQQLPDIDLTEAQPGVVKADALKDAFYTTDPSFPAASQLPPTPTLPCDSIQQEAAPQLPDTLNEAQRIPPPPSPTMLDDSQQQQLSESSQSAALATDRVQEQAGSNGAALPCNAQLASGAVAGDLSDPCPATAKPPASSSLSSSSKVQAGHIPSSNGTFASANTPYPGADFHGSQQFPRQHAATKSVRFSSAGRGDMQPSSEPSDGLKSGLKQRLLDSALIQQAQHLGHIARTKTSSASSWLSAVSPLNNMQRDLAPVRSSQSEGNLQIEGEKRKLIAAGLTKSDCHLYSVQQEVVLERLQLLPWRRIDCAWTQDKLGFFAHNNIQNGAGLHNAAGSGKYVIYATNPSTTI